MDKLKKRALELGIKFDDDIEEEALKKLVEAKESELNAQNNDIEYWKKEAEKYKSEMKKAAEKRDALKTDKAKLADKIKEMEDQMKGMTDTEALKGLKEEFETLKSFKAEFDKKAEEEKLKNMDEIERVKLETKKTEDKFKKEMEELMNSFKKEKEEWTKEKETAQERIARLRKSTLDMDIMEAAVKNKAWNPKQIVKLIRDEFSYDDNLDKYSYIKRDAKGKLEDELNVHEYVKEFLSNEENENLVKSDVNTSSFHSDKDKTTDKVLPKTGKYDPKDPDIVMEADNRDMSPERYIKTLEKRDTVMEERKKAAEK
jgi:chromosome segregation ATPase